MRMKSKTNKKNNVKKNNHLYPFFHIKKWINFKGQLYDKQKNKIVDIEHNEFSLPFYYSLGEKNSILEDRIQVFESKIGEIIKRIDEADLDVVLSGKELELLKLYCVLCGSRHEFTCEVIKEDESGIYQSNQYLWGVHRVDTQTQAVEITKQIMDDFRKIDLMKDDIQSWIESNYIEPSYIYSKYTMGMHIVIARAEQPILCISNRFCIIENTMDSDFLYFYVPISPKTALFLVKSKYYLDEKTYYNTLSRFGGKYGNGMPDPYLSVILGENMEKELLCTYYLVRSCVHVKEFYFEKKKTCSASVRIRKFPKEIFRQYNSIFCEDGDKILFCNKEELEFALRNQLDCRKIEIS